MGGFRIKERGVIIGQTGNEQVHEVEGRKEREGEDKKRETRIRDVEETEPSKE